MRLPWRRPDPIDEMRQRQRDIEATPPEDMLLLYWPGMETWSPERRRAEGQKVKDMALVEVRAFIRELEAIR